MSFTTRTSHVELFYWFSKGACFPPRRVGCVDAELRSILWNENLCFLRSATSRRRESWRSHCRTQAKSLQIFHQRNGAVLTPTLQSPHTWTEDFRQSYIDIMQRWSHSCLAVTTLMMTRRTSHSGHLCHCQSVSVMETAPEKKQANIQIFATRSTMV